LDLKQYISSGILELYAAGALSADEAREVEAMAEKHPEVKAELDAIESSLAGYAGAYSKNPRPELKKKILDKIGQMDEMSNLLYMQNVQPGEQLKQQEQKLQEEEQLREEQRQQHKQPKPPKESQPPLQQDYPRPAKFNYLMAAVWAFLALNIIGNIYFYTKLNDTQKQLSGVMDENKKMKTEYEKIKNDMDKKTNDIKMVMNRQNKVVDLKGMEISPEAFATVYWNPATKQVMLNVDNLPMPPSDKQYQLWALKDGKPIDAGVFTMEQNTSGGNMHMMPVHINDADAFAVTLEKKGGSPTPDLTQLYVMGKI
jgi:anti-sigma-K factor RskA